MENIYDLAIIGAGPVGMFAASYANMRELKCVLIDSNEQLGGQLSSLYPEKYIYDVPGFSKVLAQDLINHLKQSLEEYNFEIKLNTTLNEIEDNNSIKILKTNHGDIYAKTVIIAAGNGAFQPRKIGKINEDQFTNIKYQMSHLEEYRNKIVTILGGGDSALDWAIEISNVAKKVNVVHRREDFRAAEHTVSKALLTENIELVTPANLKEIKGSNNETTSISIQDKNTKEIIDINHDIVLVQYGYITNLKALEKLPLKFGPKNKIITNRDMSTNLDGIFAIGDCTTYESRQDLIAVGFGEAPIAVVSAARYLNPDKIIGTVHSSSIKK